MREAGTVRSFTFHRGRLALLLLTVAAASCTSPAVRVERGPVVFIVVDTLRADHLGCFGYPRPTSPSICSLEKDGVRFARAYTSLTYTTPAVASMLTGLYPNRHGLRALYLLLPGEMTTLGELFHANGYRTGAFVSSFAMVHEFSGFDQGFEIYDDDVRTKEPYRINYERPASETVDRALKWLDGAGPRTFLFLHLIEPHGPYTPPEPYLRKFALPASGPPAPPQAQIPAYQRIPDLRYVSEFVGRYDGEIRAADDQIARVLSHLRERGWYDSATVVLVADHGESMGEEGLWFCHGQGLNDAEAHVPLLIKWPEASAAPRGETVETPVSVVDLFPTVLAAAGITTDPTSHQGVDLHGVADGAERPGPPPVTMLHGDGALSVAVHGPRCTVRWAFAPPELGSDYRLTDAATSQRWADLASTIQRIPSSAPTLCQEGLTRSAAPLMTDLLTYHLDLPVISRRDAQEPDVKRRFIAARGRRTIPLDENEREALRKLGYLE